MEKPPALSLKNIPCQRFMSTISVHLNISRLNQREGERVMPREEAGQRAVCGEERADEIRHATHGKAEIREKQCVWCSSREENEITRRRGQSG